jgi:hypothetical protein
MPTNKNKMTKQARLRMESEKAKKYYADREIEEAISPKELKLKAALKAVKKEVQRAMCLHQPLHSAHEAYGVLLEEVDELWDEVKKNSKTRDAMLMREEAIQVAAMAVRFLIDVL